MKTAVEAASDTSLPRYAPSPLEPRTSTTMPATMGSHTSTLSIGKPLTVYLPATYSPNVSQTTNTVRPMIMAKA